jgi:hypothetical protein
MPRTLNILPIRYLWPFISHLNALSYLTFLILDEAKKCLDILKTNQVDENN